MNQAPVRPCLKYRAQYYEQRKKEHIASTPFNRKEITHCARNSKVVALTVANLIKYHQPISIWFLACTLSYQKNWWVFNLSVQAIKTACFSLFTHSIGFCCSVINCPSWFWCSFFYKTISFCIHIQLFTVTICCFWFLLFRNDGGKVLGNFQTSFL